MKYCSDFPGDCCDSCHDDDEQFGYALLGAYDGKGELVAIVCCKKIDAAQEGIEEGFTV
jgi:hypothetical protein